MFHYPTSKGDMTSCFDSRKTDDDTRMQVRDGIRKQFVELDNLSNSSAWPSAELDIKARYYELETKVNASNNTAYKSALSDIKKRLDTVIANKNVMEAEELKILQTYKPESSKGLLQYSVDDVKNLLEKVYLKKGIPIVKQLKRPVKSFG